MKKSCYALIVFLSALLLGACSEKEAGTSELNFPKMSWGMTWEEVMEAGGIEKEDLSDNNFEGQYSSSYMAEGYEVFGVKSDRTRFGLIDFGSGTQGLNDVLVEYPSNVDMDHVLEEMQKVYGEPIPEITAYQMLNPLVDGSLRKEHYTESEHVKIWAGISVSEAIPDGQEDEYKKFWQEKAHPSATAAFQPGLNDELWDEFSGNAKMTMVLWLEDGQEIYDSGNKLYFLALNNNVYNEITRRISEQ